MIIITKYFTHKVLAQWFSTLRTILILITSVMIGSTDQKLQWLDKDMHITSSILDYAGLRVKNDRYNIV